MQCYVVERRKQEIDFPQRGDGEGDVLGWVCLPVLGPHAALCWRRAGAGEASVLPSLLPTSGGNLPLLLLFPPLEAGTAALLDACFCGEL